MSNEDKETKWKYIPGFIRNDFWRKLIALFFAILIWQRVDSEIAELDTLRDIPVNIILPPNLEQTNDSPIKVNLKVKASRRILNNLNVKEDINIDVKIDKSTAKKQIDHRIDPKDITVPSGMTVLQVEPAVIEVPVDRKASKTVPVKLELTGYLMEGYSYKVMGIIPNSVTISGPQSTIKPMKFINAEPIKLKPDYVEDFETELKLLPKDNVTVNRRMVTVQVEIFKKYDIREFENVTIKPFGTPASPANVEIQPKQVYMRVRGVKKAVEIMQEKELNPLVNISGLKVPGKYSLEVKCWVNDKDVNLQEIKPKKIDVELKQP